MTTRVLAAAFCALLAGPAARAAEPTLESVVDAVGTRLVASHETVGVVIGVNDRGKERVFAYGAVESGDRAPTASTILQIGSVTKTFTAALLALFVQRGLVKLDDPLARWVPIGVTVPTWQGKPIRLVDLATHTSGLPRGVPHTGPSLSVEQMFRFLAGTRLMSPPGEQFLYSNLGFALLARALLRASGATTYQTLVLRELCDPLGMADTRVNLTPDEIGRRAVGYGVPGFPARVEMNTWPAFDGAGALRSTMHDMMVYLAANMGVGRGPLTPAILDMLQQRRHDVAPGSAGGVGLAWQLLPLAGSPLTIAWKNGGTAGFFAYVGFVRSTKTGVVLLANTAGPKGRAAVEILRWLNRDAVDPAARDVPVEEPPADSLDAEAW